MKYFDAHAHVQFPPYDADREEILARMKEEQIGAVFVGVDYASSEAAIKLADSDPSFFASIGLHPNYEAKEWFELDTYRTLAAHPKVRAFGECGLDYFRPTEVNEEVKKKQHNVLQDHLQLGIEFDKPLIIHSRPSKGTQDAYRDLIEILSTYKKEHGDKVRGDIHFFVGGVEEARALIELGFTLSFTAVITFTRDYDEVLRFVPIESILSETDSPYVAPSSRRGQRNDPLSIPEIVEAIAAIRGEDIEVVRTTLLANAKRLFSL